MLLKRKVLANSMACLIGYRQQELSVEFELESIQSWTVQFDYSADFHQTDLIEILESIDLLGYVSRL